VTKPSPLNYSWKEKGAYDLGFLIHINGEEEQDAKTRETRIEGRGKKLTLDSSALPVDGWEFWGVRGGGGKIN